MELNPDKFKDTEIAAQRAKVQNMLSSFDQFSNAAGYHKEAANHRGLIADLDDLQPVVDAPPHEIDTPPPSRNSIAQGPDDQGGAGPSGEPTNKRMRTYHDPFGLMPDEDFERAFHLRDNIVEAVASVDAVNQNDVEMLEANEQYLSDLGLADDMSNVQQVVRSQGARYEDGHIIIETSGLFYTWGYNFTGLDIADNNDTDVKQKWIMTPLAYIPVDWVPFYMSKAHYDDLPGEAEVVEVSCKVTPWGSRVSFQANGDTTSPATAQHVVVGCSAVGLNEDPTFNWANRDVKEETTMIIATHKNFDTAKMIKKLWGTNKSTGTTAADKWYGSIPSTFGAIRQLDVYGGPVLDDYVAAAAGPPAVAEYVPTGFPDMDTKINRFAYDAFKGKPVINYNYKPSYGVLKAKTRRWQSNRTDTGAKRYVSHGGNDPQYTSMVVARGTRDAAKNQTGTNTQIVLDSFQNPDLSVSNTNLIYDSMIEMDRCKSYVGDVGKNVRTQPQVHIGILPVQANQPGVSVGFVCAAAYWQIDRMIKIKVNFGSAYNLVVARPIDNMVSYYNDGFDDNFGLQGTIGGKIPKQQPYSST